MVYYVIIIIIIVIIIIIIIVIDVPRLFKGAFLFCCKSCRTPIVTKLLKTQMEITLKNNRNTSARSYIPLLRNPLGENNKNTARKYRRNPQPGATSYYCMIPWERTEEILRGNTEEYLSKELHPITYHLGENRRNSAKKQEKILCLNSAIINTCSIC